ncbi:MAG: hypothetical protein Q8K89_02110, partial [Actinomycetota bacterium]|nr:hypothetical protein [Actinomycetota bacterium]
REALLATGCFSAPFDGSFGYEFALAYHGDVVAMQRALLERGYLAGVAVASVEPASAPSIWGEALSNLVLFAVTEKRTRAEMDAFVGEVSSL